MTWLIAAALAVGVTRPKEYLRSGIVTDKKWMETFTKIGDKLFPSVEVVCFSSDEKSKALAWLEANIAENLA